MRAGLLPAIVLALLLCGETGRAQDAPPKEVLDAILRQFQVKAPATGVAFRAPAAGALTDDACRMQRVEMTTTFRSGSRTFSVLVDPQRDAAIKPKELLARINRMTVDADGAVRAYHPDDPFGEGVCRKVSAPDGSVALEGVCALDELVHAGIRLFVDSRQAAKPDFVQEWKAVWPLIRDRKLKPLDLTALAGPTAPEGRYLFYWKERSLTVFFSRFIIPQARDGYPCVHGAEARYPGYFVVATTLNQDGPVRPDGCAPARYIESEEIPFFVLPAPSLGHVEVGDIVIGQFKLGAREHMAYGIAADTGPFDQIGEGSIAFNQKLLGRSDVIMNAKGLASVDIDLARLERSEGRQGSMAVLVLGGTKHLLAGNYSREAIERVGREAFARWSESAAGGAQRLDACIAQAKTNPH